MNQTLESTFCKHIILEDKSQFYYTIIPYELTNAMGKIITVLQEYNLRKKDDKTGQFSCRLFKTKEGNWYEVNDNNAGVERSFLLALKTTIDSQEKSVTL